MKSIIKFAAVAVLLILTTQVLTPQTPLSKPLDEFDKLVSRLKINSLISDPIRVGNTTVIPFAKVHFDVGGADLTSSFGGGMGVQTVPLGVLIVEGDDVRAELFPEDPEKPSLLQQLFQAVLDKRITFMVNGINLGSAQGKVEDLAPLVSAMTGNTVMMVQALNLGNLKAPPAPKRSASSEDLSKLFDAHQYEEALALADSLLAQNAKDLDARLCRGRILLALAKANHNSDSLDRAIADLETVIAEKPHAETYDYLGEALRAKGSKEKAAAAFRKALELKPDDADALKSLRELQ